jgi:peptidoglycan/LPS O-acetylase OafA/YrhL
LSASGPAPAIPRVPALDGLRAIAMLGVILHHSFLATPTTGARSIDPLIERGLTMFIPLAVDLFFVISGFLITSILDRTRDADHPIRTFYARRAMRIIPLYYGFLLFVVVFLRHLPEQTVGSPEEMVRKFLFLTNIEVALDLRSVGWLFPHFWTLAIEEQFYLLWPVIILILPQRFNIRVCIALMVFSIIARIVLTSTVSLHAGIFLTPGRIDSLAAGSIVALLYHRRPEALRGSWRRFMRVSGAALLAAQAIFIPIYIWNADAGSVFWAAFMPTLATLFFASAVAGLALKQELGEAPRSLISRQLKSAARYSYGMYVFHLPIIVLLGHFGFVTRQASIAGFDTPYRIAFFLFIAALSYLAGMASWHLYEKPLLKFSPKYQYSGRTSLTGVSLQRGAIPVP